jgi:Domain of unknown function (DUF4402)
MPALTFSRRIVLVLATLMAANIAPAAALAATAIGHASVTILAAAAIIETTPIELGSVGNRISARPGIVTLSGAPNLAVVISVTANEAVTGLGPALQLAAFTHNGGRAPMLSSDGRLVLAIATTVKTGASQPRGAYSGSYSVIVNY